MSQQQRHREAEYALREALEEAHKDFALRHAFDRFGEQWPQVGIDALAGLLGAVEEYLRVCDESKRPVGRPRMTKRAMVEKYPGILNRLHKEKVVDLAAAYGVSRANVYLWRKNFPVEVQP